MGMLDRLWPRAQVRRLERELAIQSQETTQHYAALQTACMLLNFARTYQAPIPNYTRETIAMFLRENWIPNGVYAAYGLQGPIQGHQADLLIIDDPITAPDPNPGDSPCAPSSPASPPSPSEPEPSPSATPRPQTTYDLTEPDPFAGTTEYPELSEVPLQEPWPPKNPIRPTWSSSPEASAPDDESSPSSTPPQPPLSPPQQRPR